MSTDPYRQPAIISKEPEKLKTFFERYPRAVEAYEHAAYVGLGAKLVLKEISTIVAIVFVIPAIVGRLALLPFISFELKDDWCLSWLIGAGICVLIAVLYLFGINEADKLKKLG